MKRLFALALLLLLVPVSANCECDSEDILLPALIRACSTPQKLCEAYGSVRVDTQHVTKSGFVIDSVSRFAYLTEGALILAQQDDKGNVTVLGNGMGFSVSAEDELPALVFYPDTATRDRDMRAMENDFFGISDKEIIQSVTDAWDGTVVIETVQSDPRGTLQRTYTLERNTLLVQSIREELVRENEKSAMLRMITVTPQGEFTPPEALKTLSETRKTCTVRLVTRGNSGTELTDISYPEGARLRIAVPEGYGGVWADPEGTIPAEETDCAVCYLLKNH